MTAAQSLGPGNGSPMTSSTTLRSRYVTDSIETMSPARLLIALYDRLVLDLERAMTAIGSTDIAGAHKTLVHAQDIVCELSNTLDVDQWSAGPQLAAVYEFLFSELVNANVYKDACRVQNCITIVEPLRDAWQQAAGVVGRPPEAA
jgi:flagellar protein FliS